MGKKAGAKKGSGGKAAKGKGKVSGQKAQPAVGKSQRKKEDLNPWQDDVGQSLAKLGLRVKQIQADGNCFFRACADQLKGSAGDHIALRHDVVRFMREHEDDFAPYMEDDEAFEDYCKRMDKDGIWAGLHEQVALTRLCGVELRIYQASQPCWTVHPDFPEVPKDAPALHLSYHNEDHYNSVRLADDYDTGPPQRIPLVNGKVTPTEAAAAAAAAMAGDAGDEQLVQRVSQGTGCDDEGAVRQALKLAKGSADQAVEILIERLANEAAAGCTNERADAGDLPANRAVDDTKERHSTPLSGQQSAPSGATEGQDAEQPRGSEDHHTDGSEGDGLGDLNAASGPCNGPDAEGNSGTDCTVETNEGVERISQPGISNGSEEKSGPELKGTAEYAGKDMPAKQNAVKGKQPSRNRPCVCQSGRRYKNCCGAAKAAAARRQKAAEADANMKADLPEQLRTLYI